MEQWIRLSVGLILFIVVLLALYQARLVIFASLIGVGLGVLISPTIHWAKRKLRIPRGVSALLAVLLLLVGTAGISYAVVNMIITEFVPIAEKLPETLEQLRVRLTGMADGQVWLREGISGTDVAGLIQDSLRNVLKSLQATTLMGGLFIYLVAVGAYTAVGTERYRKAVLTAIPAFRRQRADFLMDEMARELRRWFFSQLVSMVFVGILVAIGLRIIGIEQWLTVGLLSAVLEFIPYIGPILATALAVVVTLASDPSSVFWVLGLFIVIQQLEANVITPLVMKTGVELPPVHLLILAMVLGSLFGLPGVFLAAPILAVSRIVYLHTFAERMESLSEPPRTSEQEELPDVA